MKISTQIAKKFMLGGPGSGTSRITGWIAIIGMAVGCFVLFLSISILNGFEKRVSQKIVGFESDIRITGFNENENIEKVINDLANIESVVQVMPYKERMGIIYNPQRAPRVVKIKSFSTDQLTDFYDMDLQRSDSEAQIANIFIGKSLADRLNLDINEEVVLVSPMDHMGFPNIGGRLQGSVRGIFRAGVLDFDDSRVFLKSKEASKLFARKSNYDGIDIRLATDVESSSVIMKIKSHLLKHHNVETWSDMHSGLFNAMKLEKVGTMVILSLIILVAAFNLTSTLVLVTFQKIKEIAILRTMGASSRHIRSIVLKQGAMIGGVGALIGSFLGLAIIYAQNKFGFIPLPEEIYMIDQVPMELYLMDIITIPLIAFIMILVASLVASKRAVKILPKEALGLEK